MVIHPHFLECGSDKRGTLERSSVYRSQPQSVTNQLAFRPRNKRENGNRIPQKAQASVSILRKQISLASDRG